MRLHSVLAGLALCVNAATAAGVLAIDYGTEWTKVSLVKPGVPFDVLLNTDSKRKIQSVAALRGDDRWIGGDAANLASRFPEASFPSVKLLLGHDTSHPQTQLYQNVYRTKLHSNSTTGKAVYQDLTAVSDSGLAGKALNHPEEYLAMQLSHAKKLAKQAAGDTVVDAIVVVPAFFTYAERQSVLDAIELAGLKPLALLDDGSAVAVNYAMTREFASDSAEHHVFYDAGAGSVRATVVGFQKKEVKDDPASKFSKNVTAVEIKGVGWDTSAGGLHMDARIRDILELQFLTGAGRTYQSSFTDNKRAQAKLLKEASRVKQVLSANDKSPSRIEGLVDEVDFSGSITREAFETACADMKAAFTKPIDDALAAAGLTLKNIDSLVFVGGISRVPMVQDAVASLVGADKIAQNLNADEAAVMGAALYGAGLSRQFKTKDIRLTGYNPYAINLAYSADPASEGPRTISATLYPAKSKLGVQKTLTLKKTHDFGLKFSYKESGTHLADFFVSGLTTAYANLTEAETSNATVTVNVLLSDSNTIEVRSAYLNVPESKEASSVKDKIKGFFGGKDKDKADDESKQAEEANSEAAEQDAKDATVLKPRGPIKLKISRKDGDFKPLTADEKKDSLQRLRDIDTAETRKRNREEAQNGLEAYLYRLRDQLESQSFIEASTESERVTIRKKLDEASEWLWDQGETAATKDLKSAKSELERAAANPVMRMWESAGRPSAIKELRMSLVQAQVFLISATEEMKKATESGDPSKYTEAELKALDTSISSNEHWLEDLNKKQEGLKLHDDPLLRISEVERRRKDLNSQVTLLQTKRPPKKAKKTGGSPPTAAAESSTATPVTTTGSGSSSASTPTTTLPARDEL